MGLAWATGHMPGAQGATPTVVIIVEGPGGNDGRQAEDPTSNTIPSNLFGSSQLGTSQDSDIGDEAILVTASWKGYLTIPSFEMMQLAGLSATQRLSARVVYATNPQIRRNIKRIVKRATGKIYSDAEIDQVMKDILKGPSTTFKGLEELGKIGPNSTLTPLQVNILNRYISELPGSPLNNQIKQGWQKYNGGP